MDERPAYVAGFFMGEGKNKKERLRTKALGAFAPNGPLAQAPPFKKLWVGQPIH